MDFVESIRELGGRVQKNKGRLGTEEATKTALVLPFIRALGYDVFNPQEVLPEFVADVAGKKGEKVDYAIMQDGKPIILIECKCCGADLDKDKKDQLHRYFLTLDSSIGILTDGVRYLFFSTADDGKNMDAIPFMEFNLEDIDEPLIPELRKLCRGKFDLQATLDTVSELKFNRQCKLILEESLEQPRDTLVEYFFRETADQGRRFTPREKERITPYVKRALNEFIAEQIDTRLKNALAATPKKEEAQATEPVAEPAAILGNVQGDGIETTQEEVEAYYIIRAIMSKVTDPERVFLRDAVSYSSVLLDDKNTKPICRLHFNAASVKYLETFDAEKKGIKHKLEKITDIQKYSTELRAVVAYYDKLKA